MHTTIMIHHSSHIGSSSSSEGMHDLNMNSILGHPASCVITISYLVRTELNHVCHKNQSVDSISPYIYGMDTTSILKTALAEHDDSSATESTLEVLVSQVETQLKDIRSVRPHLPSISDCRFQYIMKDPSPFR
jgi:hypothetical protein